MLGKTYKFSLLLIFLLHNTLGKGREIANYHNKLSSYERL